MGYVHQLLNDSVLGDITHVLLIHATTHTCTEYMY